MEWFIWLSKTGLDPSLVYEYALTFTQNELEEEDITYFSHDFLLSMGISIAKHRLEILKLARKEKARRSLQPILWFIFAMKQTKRYLAEHIQALVHRDQNAALSVVPVRNHSLRWKVAMLQRNKKLRAAKMEWPMLRYDYSPPIVEDGGKILMITNGSPLSTRSTQSSNSVESEAKRDSSANPRNSSSSNTAVQSEGGEYWNSNAEDMIKWDSMFQNLKPT